MKKLFLLTFGFLFLISLASCHEHTFASEWSKDDENHWHAATCEHTEEVSDKSAHTFNDGEITTQPTYAEDGIKTFTCTVCGYTKTESINKKTFSGSIKGHTFVGIDVQEKDYENYALLKEAVLTQTYIFKDDDTFEGNATKTFTIINGVGDCIELENKSIGTYTQNESNVSLLVIRMYDTSSGWREIPEQYRYTTNGVLDGNNLIFEANVLGTLVHIITVCFS